MSGAYPISDIECIAYREGRFDTHAAMDSKTGVYTFVKDGDYVVKTKKGLMKVTKKAGDTMKGVTYVVSKSCGVFYYQAEAES